MAVILARLSCLLLMASWLATATVAATQVAQPLLTLRLRSTDGTAVVGEAVTLERLPQEHPILPTCTTDEEGQCAWRVAPGLYQVLFRRPLDAVSAAAVAEGGLRGLGLTVGEQDITYHFTLHTDGRVYFDSAPQAAVPQPVIPQVEDLHHAPTPGPSSPAVTRVPAVGTPTTTPQPVTLSESADTVTPRPVWRLLLTLSGGLVLGGGLHWWSRRGNQRPAAGREGRDA